ncbi:uncharacterized protein V6R79_022844 [Siganus canaliculatus]
MLGAAGPWMVDSLWSVKVTCGSAGGDQLLIHEQYQTFRSSSDFGRNKISGPLQSLVLSSLWSSLWSSPVSGPLQSLVLFSLSAGVLTLWMLPSAGSFASLQP